MRFLLILVFALIGLLLGIGWFHLDTSGFFEKWNLLPNPSTEILTLFSPGTIPDEFGNPKDCDYSFPEFTFPSNHPKIIENCVQRIDRAADAYTRTVYIIDGKGEFWTWSHFSYVYDEELKKIVFPLIGISIGVVPGVLINRYFKNKHRAAFTAG